MRGGAGVTGNFGAVVARRELDLGPGPRQVALPLEFRQKRFRLLVNPVGGKSDTML